MEIDENTDIEEIRAALRGIVLANALHPMCAVRVLDGLDYADLATLVEAANRDLVEAAIAICNHEVGEPDLTNDAGRTLQAILS